jgi:hypothetical protein
MSKTYAKYQLTSFLSHSREKTKGLHKISSGLLLEEEKRRE